MDQIQNQPLPQGVAPQVNNPPMYAPQPVIQNPKSKNWLYISLVAVLVLMLAVVSGLYYKNLQDDKKLEDSKAATPTPTLQASNLVTPTPIATTITKSVSIVNNTVTFGNVSFTKPSGWSTEYENSNFIAAEKGGVRLDILLSTWGGEIANCEEKVTKSSVPGTNIVRTNHENVGKSVESANSDLNCGVVGTWNGSDYSGIKNIEESGISLIRIYQVEGERKLTDSQIVSALKEADAIVASIKVMPITQLRESLLNITWYADKGVGSGYADAIVFFDNGTYVYTLGQVGPKVTYQAEYGNYELLSNSTVRVTAIYAIANGKKISATKDSTAILEFGNFVTESEERPTPEGSLDALNRWVKVVVKNGAFGKTGKTFYNYSKDSKAIVWLTESDLGLFSEDLAKD